jgi:hypothetical protein
MAMLRPQMLGDRYRCPDDPVRNLWINGRRVFFSVAGEGIFAHRVGAPSTMKATGSRMGEATFESVLASIKPEHVLEVRYVNCWDTATSRIGTDNAIYVSLVPGATWDWANGSYIPKPRR